ncbi:MAG TPA: thioredoxin domain-containing protein [Candidatus Sulfotelmatobacter sp.]|nr:thioredoxin domain-containing protein [Candidatus Sulfotelmatobacter sp.]
MLLASLSLAGSVCIAHPTQQSSNAPKSGAKQDDAQTHPTPDEQLQQAIDSAGNDRAALVRNLEAFLQKYPEAPQRSRIYRALVESNIQLRDSVRAMNYAERIIALNPDDISMTLIAIQLLEQNGDEAGLKRAVSYSTRVLDFVNRSNDEKSPKVSQEEFVSSKNHDRMTVLVFRGRLYLKLHENAKAEKDFEDAYAFEPSAVAAEKMGEIAELNKDLPRAIQQYARAFSQFDGAKSSADRRETRQRLGNVWRLAHGSDDGLGTYLLKAYDELNASPAKSSGARNSGAKEPFEFTLRRVSDSSPLPLSSEKGKILVVNFWATWCGPCRALEPQFDRIALSFQQNHDLVFLAADCDEDETLVAPYVKETKPQMTVVFADGLDRLFAINAFPTVVIIDRSGKIVYRAEGYDEEGFQKSLVSAIHQALSPASAALQ